MGQPMLFWLKGIHFVPFRLLKNVVVLKRNSLNNYLMLICICLEYNYYNLNKEEECSFMSARNIRDQGASLEVESGGVSEGG